MDVSLSIQIPLKRKTETDKAFFERENIELEASWMRKQEALNENHPGNISVSEVKKNPKGASDISLIGFDDREELPDEHFENFLNNEPKMGPKKIIVCHLPPWCQRHPVEFPSIDAYEIHYNNCHRYICDECDAVFPTKRWLDMHLTEFHDVLAQIRKERGEKIFACFVQGCDRNFGEYAKRNRHLIDKHDYATNYNFAIVKFGVVPVSVRKVNDVIKKKKMEKKKRNKQEKNQSSFAETLDGSTPIELNSQVALDTIVPQEPDDIDMLIESMDKLSLPTSIKFGRESQRTRLPFGLASFGHSKASFPKSKKAGAKKINKFSMDIEIEAKNLEEIENFKVESSGQNI
ncbi:hypothetical protein G9A89_019172 [Geosiphon pyriformis]|nr:hypothetical protein G9A89_019172 [Geosiphon pyriformis]